jgi:hypothetical protein
MPSLQSIQQNDVFLVVLVTHVLLVFQVPQFLFILKVYRCAPISTDSVSAVSVIHSLPWPKKYLKIKEINTW